MTPKSAVLGLCLGLSAFAAAGSAYAGPAVSTRWRESEMSQDECFHYAEIAIQAAGFSRIERTTQSCYGTRGDYTAAIRCIIDHKVIFSSSPGLPWSRRRNICTISTITSEVP